MFEFKAFTTSFDDADDSDGDAEENDKFGVPEWVAFEVRKKKFQMKFGRPGTWMSEATLNTAAAGLIRLERNGEDIDQCSEGAASPRWKQLRSETKNMHGVIHLARLGKTNAQRSEMSMR